MYSTVDGVNDIVRKEFIPKAQSESKKPNAVYTFTTLSFNPMFPTEDCLILKLDLLSLDTSDDNIGCVLGNNLIVVQHFELLACITAHVAVECLWSTLNDRLVHWSRIMYWKRSCTHRVLIDPVR